MDFAFSAEQQMLRDTARRFLEDKAPSTVVRRLMETDAGFDPALWRATADMGWQAMAIPEAYGGAGFSPLETGILMEEMGRAPFPAPQRSSPHVPPSTLLASTPGQWHQPAGRARSASRPSRMGCGTPLLQRTLSGISQIKPSPAVTGRS